VLEDDLFHVNQFREQPQQQQQQQQQQRKQDGEQLASVVRLEEDGNPD